MTVAQKRSINPKLENKFLSGLQKQLPELIPPLIALAIFLAIWQVFSWTPGQLYQDQSKLFKILGS